MTVIELFYYLIIKKRDTYPKKTVEECSLTYQEELYVVEGKMTNGSYNIHFLVVVRGNFPIIVVMFPRKEELRKWLI